jgi:hypothetical protein
MFTPRPTAGRGPESTRHADRLQRDRARHPGRPDRHDRSASTLATLSAELRALESRAARCARRGSAPAPSSGLGEALAGARRPRRYRTSLIGQARMARTRSCTMPSSAAIQCPAPGRRVWSLPSIASHAIGFAEPRPDVHSPGLGTCVEDGEDQAAETAVPEQARRYAHWPAGDGSWEAVEKPHSWVSIEFGMLRRERVAVIRTSRDNCSLRRRTPT